MKGCNKSMFSPILNMILICIMFSFFENVRAQTPEINWFPSIKKQNLKNKVYIIDDNRFVTKNSKTTGPIIKYTLDIHTLSEEGIKSTEADVGSNQVFYGCVPIAINQKYYRFNQNKEKGEVLLTLEQLDNITLKTSGVLTKLYTEKDPPSSPLTYQLTQNENHIILRRNNSDKSIKIVLLDKTTFEVVNELNIKSSTETKKYTELILPQLDGSILVLSSESKKENAQLFATTYVNGEITSTSSLELENINIKNISHQHVGTHHFFYIVASEKNHGNIPTQFLSLELRRDDIELLSTVKVDKKEMLSDFDKNSEADYNNSYNNNKDAPRDLAPYFYINTTHVLKDMSSVTVFCGRHFGNLFNNFYIQKTNPKGEIEWVKFIRFDYSADQEEARLGSPFSYIDESGNLQILFTEFKQMYDEAGEYIPKRKLEKKIYTGDQIYRILTSAYISMDTKTGEYSRHTLKTGTPDMVFAPALFVVIGGKIITYACDNNTEQFGVIEK